MVNIAMSVVVESLIFGVVFTFGGRAIAAAAAVAQMKASGDFKAGRGGALKFSAIYTWGEDSAEKRLGRTSDRQNVIFNSARNSTKAGQDAVAEAYTQPGPAKAAGQKLRLSGNSEKGRARAIANWKKVIINKSVTNTIQKKLLKLAKRNNTIISVVLILASVALFVVGLVKPTDPSVAEMAKLSEALLNKTLTALNIKAEILDDVNNNRNVSVPKDFFEKDAYLCSEHYVGVYDSENFIYEFVHWENLGPNDLIDIANNNNEKGIFIYTIEVQNNIITYLYKNHFYHDHLMEYNDSLDRDDDDYDSFIPSKSEYYFLSDLLPVIKYCVDSDSGNWFYVAYQVNDNKESVTFPNNDSNDISKSYKFPNVETKLSMENAFVNFYQGVMDIIYKYGLTISDKTINTDVPDKNIVPYNLLDPRKLYELAVICGSQLPGNAFAYSMIPDKYLGLFLDFVKIIIIFKKN
jgi:hypothetical protein